MARYDGILCRGVLYDFVNDDARLSVFAAFTGALRRSGVLILDVREWEATRDSGSSSVVLVNVSVPRSVRTLFRKTGSRLNAGRRGPLQRARPAVVADHSHHTTADALLCASVNDGLKRRALV